MTISLQLSFSMHQETVTPIASEFIPVDSNTIIEDNDVINPPIPYGV